MGRFERYQGKTVAKAKEKLQALLYREQVAQAWEEAQGTDEINVYEAFMRDFPQETDLIAQAKKQIALLEEHQIWQSNTEKINAMLEAYTKSYPQGIYIKPSTSDCQSNESLPASSYISKQ
ncbi:hypothetical protein [Thermoflexibacter ruber]|uniref:Uncharacterized protein n=1 Tax=Thermoflexibacter ruber TaxID=1003 RepID=A0A1I2GQ64_9BACT|nr:hypothetical protein [Thermoflexibacter ruber]SFF19612.1 hypothetical protein SAMN04488541_101989 [Thermoflexibacter ruber]